MRFVFNTDSHPSLVYYGLDEMRNECIIFFAKLLFYYSDGITFIRGVWCYHHRWWSKIALSHQLTVRPQLTHMYRLAWVVWDGVIYLRMYQVCMVMLAHRGVAPHVTNTRGNTNPVKTGSVRNYAIYDKWSIIIHYHNDKCRSLHEKASKDVKLVLLTTNWITKHAWRLIDHTHVNIIVVLLIILLSQLENSSSYWPISHIWLVVACNSINTTPFFTMGLSRDDNKII